MSPKSRLTKDDIAMGAACITHARDSASYSHAKLAVLRAMRRESGRVLIVLGQGCIASLHYGSWQPGTICAGPKGTRCALGAPAATWQQSELLR